MYYFVKIVINCSKIKYYQILPLVNNMTQLKAII